tara:strand:- start:109 stop:723 length:615 start_codon:yes stop_codon:yes gene_type:complete
MALLGWNPGTDRELFTLKELVEEFKLKNIQKGGAAFDIEKLNWFNKEYIKKMPEDELFIEIKKYILGSEKMARKILPIMKERINTFGDLKEMADSGELDYYSKKPKYEVEDLLWKTETDLNIVVEHLQAISDFLEKIPDNKFNADEIKKSVWKYAEEKGRGQVLWPMRYALSGKDKSPDPFVLAEVLGREETLSRLKNANDKIR